MGADFWDDGQPNDGGGLVWCENDDQNCGVALADTSLRLNDAPCGEGHRGLCQRTAIK